MKNKVLCLLHLPPPYHGVAIINKNIIASNLCKHFILDTIPINTSKKLTKVEKILLEKFIIFPQIVFALLKKLVLNRYCFCYFSPSLKGIAFYKDMILVLILKIFRLKRLYHLHGKGISLRKGFVNRGFYRFFFKNCKVIIVSQALFYDIKDYVDIKDVFILPNAIKQNLDDCEFEKVMQERTNRKEIVLLFLSNMIMSKGVFIALDAAKILKEKGYNFKFYFVGDWQDISKNNFLNEVSRCGLSNQVKHLGFKKGKEKNDILKKSDIFVFPTYNDIFSIVNIEAMEFGLPIISTNEGAIPEIVEDNKTGFIVQPKNRVELAGKIEVLIKDKALRISMGRQGRQKFIRDYLFEKLEKELINIFHKTIAS